jgi:DNA-directed RNA polymerase sigma subunit (sigma70/sigma32)
METRTERSPALATPGSLVTGSANGLIVSRYNQRPKKPQAHRILTADEERLLAERWQHHSDKHARDCLIAAFQPLVRSYIEKHRYGLPKEDLCQSANIGRVFRLTRAGGL